MSGRAKDDNVGTQYLQLRGHRKAVTGPHLSLWKKTDRINFLVSIVNWIIVEKYPFFFSRP